MKHRGRAVVFEDIDDYKARIDDETLDIDETCVMVLKNCGPRGYPGMAEVGNMGLPPKVLRKGITDMVRISRRAHVGHRLWHRRAAHLARGGARRAAGGGAERRHDRARRAGPAPASRHPRGGTGSARLAAWKPRSSAPAAAIVQLYHDHVEGADTGADLDFLKGCRGQRRGPGVPLMATPFPVALVGVGKIARDQHIPAIAADPDFPLVAGVSRHATVEGVPNFADLDRFLAEGPHGGGGALHAARGAHCDGAWGAGRRARRAAREAARRRRWARSDLMVAAARETGAVLFATWHSRFAPAVAAGEGLARGASPEASRSSGTRMCGAGTPNQAWIWQAGGFGVFDPGINALSILTEILPGRVRGRPALASSCRRTARRRSQRTSR